MTDDQQKLCLEGAFAHIGAGATPNYGVQLQFSDIEELRQAWFNERTQSTNDH